MAGGHLRTPSAIACAMPNFGTFLAHSGLKWSVRQILPPRYIFAVLPSSSGSAISGAVAGYVIGICWRRWERILWVLCNCLIKHCCSTQHDGCIPQIRLWTRISANYARTSMSRTTLCLLYLIRVGTSPYPRPCYSAHTAGADKANNEERKKL